MPYVLAVPARKSANQQGRPKKKAAKKATNRRRSSDKKKTGKHGTTRGKMVTKTGMWATLWPFLVLNRLTANMKWWWKWPLRLGGHPAIVGLLVLIIVIVIYGARSSRHDLNQIHAMRERTVIVDRHGRELGRMHGEKRSIVPLETVAKPFRMAILAREDERFYYHPGFDPIGMVRAFVMNLRGKREGASTITQQLASDIFQLKAKEKRGQFIRQIDRKFLEIAIAVRLEMAYSKDELLEAYINQINWGRQIKGIGEASRVYFEKHPAELDLSESAMLAGIVRGPDAYNPFRSMEKAERERNSTLTRMVSADKISQQEADQAKEKEIVVRPMARRQSRESYAMNAIRRDLDIILEQEDIQLGGLIITTTIDLRVQQVAEKALDDRLSQVEKMSGYRHQTRADWNSDDPDGRKEPKYMQGAAVVIENRTGGVLAVVGGRNVQESRFNRSQGAMRQIGSIFKPFVYLAAFDKGMRPNTPMSDAALQRGEIYGAETWNPKNSDGQFGGMHPASYGLIRSRNTMSVRVGNYAGMKMVQFVGKLAGFNKQVPPTPASYLGSFEASPWEVATAYSIFPNEGTRYRPYLVSEIRDRDGNILYTTRPLSYQAATRSSSLGVSSILQQVTQSGTAASIKRLGFNKPCAGKTGTTDEFKDAWFAGYTSQLSCAVWVGFDQPKRTISSGYGSVLALPVWANIMKRADEMGYKAGTLHNRNKIKVNICRLSGKYATSGCAAEGHAQEVWLPADTAPQPHDLCPLHPARAIAIDPKTGQPLAPKANIVTSGAPRAVPPPRAKPAPPPRAVPRAQPVR